MKFAAFLLLTFCTFSYSAIAKMSKIEPTVIKKNEAGSWIYEKVVDVPNADKAKLYSRLKKHIQTTVQSSDNVMTFDDVKNETIITSPTLSLTPGPFKSQQLNFKLTVDFKDNKFRVFATSFSYHTIVNVYEGGALETYQLRNVYAEQISKKVDEALKAFFNGVESAGKSGEKKEW